MKDVIAPPERFELFTADKHSPLWQRLKLHIEARIQELRAKNDGELSEIETAKLRGRIAELKALLSLESEPPQVS